MAPDERLLLARGRGMDAETAIAILLANKGRKDEKKDYLAMGEAARYLKWQHGSFARAAKLVGYSGETLRELDKLLDLPEEVQRLVRYHTLGQDAHKVLLVRPASRQMECARAVVGLSTADARAVLEYVRKNPNTPVEQCKQHVLESRTIKGKLFVVVVPLSEEDYVSLQRRAEKMGASVDEVVRGVVRDWLQKEE